MMNTTSYNINTREGEKVSFDLESMEFVVTVLKAGQDCTVIDNKHNRLYFVKAVSTAAAVIAYVDWLFGMVNVWAADEDEFGCYEKTAEECWASLCCDFREVIDVYDLVAES
jgi:hypothetical protein